MKKEDMYKAVGNIDDELIKNSERSAESSKPARFSPKRWIAVAAGAMLLVGAWFGKGLIIGNNGNLNDVLVAEALTPDYSSNKTGEEYLDSEEGQAWAEKRRTHLLASYEVQYKMANFYRSAMTALIGEKDGKNKVCSPLNVYFALSMLAETADGNTRAQILELLDVRDTDELQMRTDIVWNANFCNNPLFTCNLANSFWMNKNIVYNKPVLQTLAEKYHASSFSGEMGTPEMDNALREWTNQNTGGLLKEHAKGMNTLPETVLELVSTIYYKAFWGSPFSAAMTKEEVFHGAQGDQACMMMKRTETGTYYYGDKFSAVALGTIRGGSMFVILPDEGISPEELAGDEEIFDMLNKGYEYGKQKYLEINMSIPKFKVDSKLELGNSLKALGITDAFDPGKADFSALVSKAETQVFLSKADHAAMVEIDEEGVTGAAYTNLGLNSTAMPPDEKVDFVVDRPFLFIVRSEDGSMLFSGVVNTL